MHRINTNSKPVVFLEKLTKLSHLYTTRFSQLNYIKPTHKLSCCKYRISISGAYLWNKYLMKKEKKNRIIFQL